MTKVVFFGSSRHILPIIQTLREEFELCLVVTTEESPTDLPRGKAGAVPAYCTFAKIPFISVKHFDEKIVQTIQDTSAEVSVLGYFGLLLPKKVLDIFPKGIINIHPSLLPKYRGPTPIQTAILNGDTMSGVTIIRLDEELDHGPILKQVKEPILPTDSSESLYQKYNITGAQMLPGVLQKYMAGKLTPKDQDHSQATYTKHLERKSGFVDLQNPPSKEMVDRMIRAYYPWPGVHTKLKVQSSTHSTNSGQAFKILKLLPNRMVQLEGKTPVELETFFRGYPETKEPLFKLFI